MSPFHRTENIMVEEADVVHHEPVATRNVGAFNLLEVELLDPFEYKGALRAARRLQRLERKPGY